MKFFRDSGFKASKSTKSVTKNLHVKHFRILNIMDTPGFNDPDKEQKLNDASIYQQITRMI